MDKQNAKQESDMVALRNQEINELQDVEYLAKIIHKHFQYLKSDWEEYTKSDLALAYAIKWNGYRKERDTAREIFEWLKAKVIMTEIPHGSEPCEEDVEAVMWWQIEEHFKKRYGVDLGGVNNV